MEVSDSYTVASTESLQTRIQYYLVKNAVTIAAEDPLTDTRQRLVRAILENRLSIHNVTLMVLSNPTIAAMSDPSTVSDSVLLSTVSGLTAALSLIV
jgi:hypothetical protein